MARRRWLICEIGGALVATAKNWYLICYDIRDPKRWRKAYKLLKGYGGTVQYSIFRCQLSQRDREKLRWELEKILDPSDRILFAGLCHRCVERVHHCNRSDAWGDEPAGFKLL
jgi:CRISPR-associated protein Cas2